MSTFTTRSIYRRSMALLEEQAVLPTDLQDRRRVFEHYWIWSAEGDTSPSLPSLSFSLPPSLPCLYLFLPPSLPTLSMPSFLPHSLTPLPPPLSRLSPLSPSPLSLCVARLGEKHEQTYCLGTQGEISATTS